MSDTPRTDALIKPNEKDMVVLYNEMLEHARQLERDLSRVIGQFNAAVLELAQRPEEQARLAWLRDNPTKTYNDLPQGLWDESRIAIEVERQKHPGTLSSMNVGGDSK